MDQSEVQRANHTPYLKIAAILVFFGLLTN